MQPVQAQEAGTRPLPLPAAPPPSLPAEEEDGMACPEARLARFRPLTATDWAAEGPEEEGERATSLFTAPAELTREKGGVSIDGEAAPKQMPFSIAFKEGK